MPHHAGLKNEWKEKASLFYGYSSCVVEFRNPKQILKNCESNDSSSFGHTNPSESFFQIINIFLKVRHLVRHCEDTITSSPVLAAFLPPTSL